MKSTGIVRKVDELGRIVIPMELRRTLQINEKDPVEIFVDGKQIVLKKYTAAKSCFVTGEVNDDNISLLDGRLVLSPESAKYLLNELKKSVKS
ncbi:AbrB/MazE/SpoVT family DNA-binding domain-containing protein [Ureibacillus sp. FSL W8-0352]|uniref:AbrB/MazE/SpoVT family DNA-binding domain-containing protein n=1 Tax=Ureibacillus sp. FSL W8-0352 TaxID=2954596 RepID=UPI0030F903BD